MNEKKFLFKKIKENENMEYSIKTNNLIEQFMIDLTPKQEKEFIKLMEVIQEEQNKIEFLWYTKGINTLRNIIF